jgi:Arm DNA-binding domain
LLLVKPSGAKVWVARVTVNGKRRDVGLGGFPTVGLREARENAAAIRKQAGSGLDRIVERERLAREREAQCQAATEAET